MRTIRPSALMAELKACALSNTPAMIWGPPGSGKSDIVYQLSTALAAKLFEVRANLADPVDVRGGLKVIEQQNGTFRTRYGVPEDYPDPDYLGNIILFLDELPNATKATMNAYLQLILNKRMGTYELPEQTIIIAAGNRAEDRAAVHEMPTTVKTRFNHFTLEPHIDCFCAYAVKNDIHESIISFLRFRPGLLYALDPKQNASPTPRGWEMLSRKLPFMEDEYYGCASVIGDGPAGEFITFKSLYKDLPDLDQLIKSPATTKVPDSPSVLYAICGGLSVRANKDTFKPIMRYVRRIPPEFQVIVVRDCLAKDATLVQEEAYTSWAEANAEVLL